MPSNRKISIVSVYSSFRNYATELIKDITEDRQYGSVDTKRIYRSKNMDISRYASKKLSLQLRGYVVVGVILVSSRERVKTDN